MKVAAAVFALYQDASAIDPNTWDHDPDVVTMMMAKATVTFSCRNCASEHSSE